MHSNKCMDGSISLLVHMQQNVSHYVRIFLNFMIQRGFRLPYYLNQDVPISDVCISYKFWI